MDDSKFFSKVHEAYKESFEFLQDLGIFGTENSSKKRKLWILFIITLVIFYPNFGLWLGYGSVESFGDFVEQTVKCMALLDVTVRQINLKIWQKKIIEIAGSFQELQKFDEHEIVKKSEFALRHLMKYCLGAELFFGTFYCIHQNYINDKNVILDWIQFENVHVSIVIGIVDWVVVMFLASLWVTSQTILFTAYTQLTAHLKGLGVKFSRVVKPKYAEESKENLEKLHEIIAIHQKLKR
jgi:hypothetical protein